ncbi:hypothetical protein Q7P37_009075 [Cladosporium fusiforme]
MSTSTKTSTHSSTRTSTFNQFNRFTTDAYGIERILRALQATLQILIHHPPPLFLHESLAPLNDLSTRLGQIRRTIRFFRFLPAFANGYAAFASLATGTKKPRDSASNDTKNRNDKDNSKKQAHSPPPSSPPIFLTTLSGLAATFDGLYYLLEALTLPDALSIPHFRLLPPHLSLTLSLLAQRSWFLALAFSALACLVRLSNLSPAAKQAESRHEQASQRDQARQRAQLLRKMAACVLDMALPGSVLGWIPAEKGTVGWVMLGTSLLTGVEVWERCGREVGGGLS